jgi:hypothetical protein
MGRIVGQHVGLLLRRRPAPRRHHRDLANAQLLRRHDSAMACNDAAVLIDQDRRCPTPFLDAGRYLRDLLR